MPSRNGGGGDDRRLTRQGQERKQQLLDHAARLFAERGFADTRVIDIVRAAGVAKGLFYWYFENKEALFKELVETTRHRMRQQQLAAIDADASPLERLRQGVEASLRFMHEHQRLYEMFSLDGLDPELAEQLRTASEVHTFDTANHIRAAIDAGQVRDDDPVLLAYGVVGTVAYFNHLHRAGRISLSLDELCDFVGRFVVNSLAASDDSARFVERTQRRPAVSRKEPAASGV